MKISNIFLTISFLFIFNVVWSQNPTIKSESDSLPLSLYKIEKIKRIKSLFIIYATLDNDRYKIISLKEQSKPCTKIRKGNSYNLILSPYFDKNDLSNSIVTKVVVYGTTITLTDDCHFNLYFTSNLKGICYFCP